MQVGDEQRDLLDVLPRQLSSGSHCAGFERVDGVRVLVVAQERPRYAPKLLLVERFQCCVLCRQPRPAVGRIQLHQERRTVQRIEPKQLVLRSANHA
jgi:hypothetical protein